MYSLECVTDSELITGKPPGIYWAGRYQIAGLAIDRKARTVWRGAFLEVLNITQSTEASSFRRSSPINDSLKLSVKISH